MAITKPKISSLVSSQLPEFIQEDYTTFVAFLEAYYEYLESQVIIDFAEISDIDTTLDSFIKYFKNELALNFPTTLVDDRFLLPKLKELYISKGSEASYKLLFKILYNKDIDIKYPATQMLRTSDGKWSQPISIFILVQNGSPDDIVGKTVDIISTIEINSIKITAFIDSYELTNTNNVYECFLLGSFTGVFNIGDLVNHSTTFSGRIAATTTSLSIIQAGKNFKIGQTYDVSSGGGIGSVIRVDSINIDGGITVARFVNFGINYSNSFTTNILASANNISNIQSFFTITGSSPSYSVDTTDIVDQISDEGIISLYNYASTTGAGTYFEANYAGPVLSTFYNKSENVVIDPLDYAIIDVQLGSIARYPGYYKNNDGFLDDNIYIQDSRYYQSFSYAIQIDERFDSYKSIVKNLIHPSGTEIFGEYTINNELDVNIGIGLTILYPNYVFNLITENSDQLITESGDVIQAIII